MASFAGLLNVFKSIWTGTEKVVNFLEPLDGVIGTIPVVGGPAVTIINLLFGIEHGAPVAGIGAAKKAAVATVMTAAHPGIDQAIVSSATDGLVAHMNGIQAILTQVAGAVPPVKP